MKSTTWGKKIKNACVEAGTYQPCFDQAIKMLSEIMEERDKVYSKFVKSGGNAVIKHTNKGGAVNLAKNPMLIIWDELNKSALAYWRDLGLTPSGYKKIMGDQPKGETPSALAEALKNIGG